MKTPDPYEPTEAFVPPIFGDLIGLASNLASTKDRDWGNTERAASAHLSCLFFGALTKATSPDDSECNVRDLLTNLMHHCEVTGFDFADNLRIASDHYRHESDNPLYRAWK